jgi:hypothetical protein
MIGEDASVHLLAGESASIELSGADFTGTLRGEVDFLRTATLNCNATLEIIDTATGVTKLVLTASERGQSSSGNGGGGGN